MPLAVQILASAGGERAQAMLADLIPTLYQRSPGGPRLVRTPAGIDPGFAYAPGRHYFESRAG